MGRPEKEKENSMAKNALYTYYIRHSPGERAKWWFKRPAYSVPGKKNSD